MSEEAIRNRIAEFEESHMVSGGTHIEELGDQCPTCKTIRTLEGLLWIYARDQTWENTPKRVRDTIIREEE